MNPVQLPFQKGLVVWLFGLSGSGKTTISALLQEKLAQDGFYSIALDGDDLRTGINSDLSFSDTGRQENIRRAAEIAKIMLTNNVITICSFITPLQKHRTIVSEIIRERYVEVFVDCPIDVCRNRDVKGLYKQAEEHTLLNFTGISSAFESSVSSNLILRTAEESPSQSIEKLYQLIFPLIVRKIIKR